MNRRINFPREIINLNLFTHADINLSSLELCFPAVIRSEIIFMKMYHRKVMIESMIVKMFFVYCM